METKVHPASNCSSCTPLVQSPFVPRVSNERGTAGVRGDSTAFIPKNSTPVRPPLGFWNLVSASTKALVAATLLLFGGSCTFMQEMPVSEKPIKKGAQTSEEKEKTLFLVGGGESPEALELFAESNKNVTIVTVASGHPKTTGPRYVEAFRELWGKESKKTIHVVDMRNPKQAEYSTQNFQALENPDGIYLSGGDQKRILRNMPPNSWVAKRMKELYERGTVVGGTSAGAAPWGDQMLSDGQLFKGFGWLGKVIVDQHYSQKHRRERLCAKIGKHPDHIGFGIDERTIAIFKTISNRTMLEVKGRGGVHVVLGGSEVYVLRDGDRYNLTTRKPIFSPEHQTLVAAKGR